MLSDRARDLITLDLIWFGVGSLVELRVRYCAKRAAQPAVTVFPGRMCAESIASERGDQT